MVERSNEEDGILDQAALAEPLIAALDDADADIRTATLWALLSLPLAATTWLFVGRHANTVLLEHNTRSPDELLSVIGATPWIPVASTRELVAHVARGEFEVDEAVRIAAITALDRVAKTRAVEPTSSPAAPAGFSQYSAGERHQLRHELSKRTVDELWAELRKESSSTLSRRREAVVVTLLMERADSAGDLRSGYEVTRWVEDRGTAFMPDLEGLFNELLRLRPSFPRSPELLLARQIVWLVSRGGVIPLVAALQTNLESAQREERLAALSLIQYAAAFMGAPSAPTYWGGIGAEPAYQEPAIEPRTELVDEIDTDRDGMHDDELHVDDDVQFTMYRPSRVQPEVWHPIVAFAHRTEPIALPGGGVMHPVEEVEQRAAQLLSGLPTSYETVRGDSDAGLPRGTDLLFEPWIETGEFNPSTQSLRWEEAIHEVHFRLRVPQSADGSRLRGGMRVFAGAVLIGDLAFRLPVSSEEPAASAPIERDTTRRFRQIFASYSHRDVAVVDAVERYVSVTGDRYLIDARTLRSGEVWNERLCQLIHEADIFQLFWSDNAMNSTFVRQEWEYALQLSREGFVRPVYWDDPLAEDPDRNLPPTELRRIHFSRLRVDPGAAIGLGARVPSDEATATPGDPPPVAGSAPWPTDKPIISASTDDEFLSDLRHDSPGTSAAPAPARARVVCATCGFVNEADEVFCGSCGSFLDWTGQKVESPASAPPPAPPARTPSPVAPAAPAPSSPAKRPALVVKQPPTRNLEPGDLICGTCGEGNAPGRRFCARCGTSLAEAVVSEQRRWRIPARRRRTLQAGERPWRDKAVRRRKRWPAGMAALMIATSLVVVLLVFK